jgi:WD40 repeat protein
MVFVALLASSVALGGCVDSNVRDKGEGGSASAQAEHSGWSFDEDEAQEVSSFDCAEAVEPSWFQPASSPWWHHRNLSFSPNRGLLRRTDAMTGAEQVHRTSDGEVFYGVGGSNLHAIDASWSLEARSQAYTRNVDIVRRGESDSIATIDLEQDQSTVINAAFGPQAETVGLLTCRDDVTSAVVWSLAEDRQVLRTVLEPQVSCRYWSRTAPEFSYTPDGRALVVLMRETGRLIHVDLERGQTRSVIAHQPQESDVEMLRIQGGIDLAVHPSGQFVATSGVEGKVRFWKLPSLESTGASFDSGVAAVNLYTYAMPHRVSPLAWSPDGGALASMAEDGSVVLRAPSGEVLSTLLAPQVDPVMPAETTPWIDNPPTSIAFDRHGRIAVGAYTSVGIWECGEPESVRIDEPLDATIHFDGPRTLEAGKVGVFNAQIEGAESPVVTRLLIDGEVHGGFSTHSWRWHSSEVGDHRARLEVDDGQKLAIVEMNLEVTQADE